MNELALFAGAGGGILGGELLGWRTVCAVEWEPYPASVLCARQNDGLLPPFPIWDDIQTFDGNPWRGIVDVVSGGFPCTDISAAGKGAGIDGEASGMWREMARVICEVRPRFVFVENSPMLTSRGLGRVLGDLATMGFDARWGVLGAADIGAPHQRDRIWIVANSNNARIERREQQSQSIQQKSPNVENPRHRFGWDKRTTERGQNPQGEWTTDSNQIGRPGEQPASMAHTMFNRLQGVRENRAAQGQTGLCRGEGSHQVQDLWGTADYWSIEPTIPRVADGVAARVDRLKAIGNGQVPLCAATAWRILNDQK
jgi:DNA (cytosine-5)-methyltransferase 1